MKTRNQGFTLVEIMIVVAIIAILAAVAIPNFVKYRRSSQATACISNLKQIQTASEQARMSKGESATIAFDDIIGTDKFIKTAPPCPAGGSYTMPADSTSDPACSLGTTLNSTDPSVWHQLKRTTTGSTAWFERKKERLRPFLCLSWQVLAYY